MKKMRTRIGGIMLALILVLTMMSVSALAVDSWDGTSATTDWYNANANEVTIDSAADLAGLAKLVNDGTNFSGKTVKLTANIDLAGKDWSSIGNGTRSGSSYTGYAFKGTFDGNGKTISGLKISEVLSDDGVDNAIGLFGVVDGGTVKDLTLTGVDINVSGGECVGGFIGLMVNEATASSLTMGTANGTDTITAVRGLGGIVGRMTIRGTIENCVNYANISGSGANVGGIAGAAYYTAVGSEMTISNCDNYGTITCTAGVTGGIVGFSAAKVIECENTANVSGNGISIGGIVGEQQNAGNIESCINSGNVTNGNTITTEGGGYGTGGIVGWVRYSGAQGDYARKEVIKITGSNNSGNVTSGSIGAGGIIGMAYHAVDIENCENVADSIEGQNMVGGIIGGMQSTDNLHPGTGMCGLVMANNTTTTASLKVEEGQPNIGLIMGHPLQESSFTGSNCGTAEDSIWTIYGNQYAGIETSISSGIDTMASVALVEDEDGNISGYPTLQEAINAAQNGETVKILENVDLTVSLNLSGKSNITIQGASDDVTISASGISGHKAFNSAPSGKLTLKDLTFTDAIVTINGASGAVKVDNCTFKDTSTTQGDKSGVLNVINSKNGASLEINGCTFENLTRDESATGAEFVGVYTSGLLESISITDSKFKDIAGTALSLRGTSSITITGNEFENWADGSADNAGRAVRIDFGGNADPTLKFNDNKMQAGAQAVESYVKIGEIAADGKPALDLSKNYWDGKDPAGAIVTEGVPVLEIIVGGTAFDEESLKDSGADVYYKDPSMDENDLNTYVPSIPDPNGITVTQPANGSIKVNPSNGSAGTLITVTATPDKGYELAYVTVDGKRIEGTTFKMPDHAVTVSAVFVPVDFPFTDVKSGDWFYDYVAYVYSNGLMDGTSATTFEPNANMTRAMVWAILARIDGETVTGSNWADTARTWAMAEGVSDGTDPNGLVTREQFATMLYRYAVAKGYDVSIGEDTNILSYADFDEISEWAIPAIQWACGSGIITGVTDATIVPQGNATRAQCAAMLMRYCAIAAK